MRDISSPPALKAEQCLVEALREFSLLEDWAPFTKWVTPVSWAGNTATLPENTIKAIGCKVDGVTQTFVENWVNLRDGTWSIPSYNQATVYNRDVTQPTLFSVVLLPQLPVAPNLDIDVPVLHLTAILKRALALFTLRHLDDVNLGSQYTAEYELLVNQLRSRDRLRPNGAANIYRNGR